MTAYAISRRRIEIGIRLALGAPPTGVVALVLGRVLTPGDGGSRHRRDPQPVGLRIRRRLDYGLPPRDPATLVGAASILLALGVFAAWLPARRAVRIDPGAVLREG